ncbi:MAG TPA: hypothetical protein DEB40_01060 [Elusimicrobia bacterium]|nr:hypothetical protein [Elusimicrobiota bacterium]HBT60319.1 hypothetical protein [Elusimicrobiota bacterium]
MMKSPAFAACAWAAFLAVPLSLGAQAGPTALSWEDCVALALRNNPDLAASRRGQEASRASYRGSFNGLFPQLSLSHNYSETGGGRGAGKTWQAQAAASMDLFNASNIAAIKSSKASLAQAQAGLRQSSASVRFNLRQAFLQLLFSQANLETSAKIKDLRTKSSKLVALRYDSGRESLGNKLRAQAQAAQAQADHEIAGLDLRTAQRSLVRQLGLDEFRAFAATGTLEAQAPPEEPLADSAVLERRPDVAVQQAVVKGFMAGVEQAKSSLWPSLSANYTRSRSGATEFPSSQYGWTFGGVLSYPLFGNGPTAAYYAVSAAQRGLEKAKEDLRTVRSQAIVDLENSWTDFSAAVARDRVQAALLTAARQRNIEADIRYDSGLLTYDNWEIISSDRISQERQTLASRLNAVVAQAAWEKALGKELGE